jgi:hypothetical protein
LRDDVFCDATHTTCSYPDPSTKDIYIENDWMVNPGLGTYSMKLSDVEVAQLQSAFAAKGINLHIDTGQLGGGNEVPYNASISFTPQPDQIDFYDYKDGGDGITAQMASVRHGIYHYLLTGYSYSDTPDSSGISYPGDDDMFVSYGLIKDEFAYDSFDTAISGTVMHELGHNLCLTPLGQAYPGQAIYCQFAGVDQADGNSYNSVMNYDKQLALVDFSTGVNGSPTDHNDWGTIQLSDFAFSSSGDADHGVTMNKNSLDVPARHRYPYKQVRPIPGPSVQELKYVYQR